MTEQLKLAKKKRLLLKTTIKIPKQKVDDAARASGKLLGWKTKNKKHIRASLLSPYSDVRELLLLKRKALESDIRAIDSVLSMNI